MTATVEARNTYLVADLFCGAGARPMRISGVLTTTERLQGNSHHP